MTVVAFHQGNLQSAWLPSHASMGTGLPPWQHRVSRNGLRLSEQLHIVPDQLEEDAAHIETHLPPVSDHGESFDEAGSADLIESGLRLVFSGDRLSG